VIQRAAEKDHSKDPVYDPDAGDYVPQSPLISDPGDG
jgi:hypothetical protein